MCFPLFLFFFLVDMQLKEGKSTKWIIAALDSSYWHNGRQEHQQLVNASCQKALHGSVFFEDTHREAQTQLCELT